MYLHRKPEQRKRLQRATLAQLQRAEALLHKLGQAPPAASEQRRDDATTDPGQSEGEVGADAATAAAAAPLPPPPPPAAFTNYAQPHAHPHAYVHPHAHANVVLGPPVYAPHPLKGVADDADDLW